MAIELILYNSKDVLVLNLSWQGPENPHQVPHPVRVYQQKQHNRRYKGRLNLRVLMQRHRGNRET